MQLFITILVTFFAGMGAGLGTGLAGMSAAAVIAPMLIVFLDVDPYLAVGIALASDVLASAVSAATYARHKNIDLKNGLVLMVTILLFTIVGSFVASKINAVFMGSVSMFLTVFLGIKFIVKPITTTKEQMLEVSAKKRFIRSVISGVIVGFICGFVGAGGGIMMLILLTGVLGYELKTAVGTSVFIMTFTALLGSVSHFVLGGKPDILILCLCVGFTFIWARLAAKFANKVSPLVLNRSLGVVLLVLGIATVIFNFV